MKLYHTTLKSNLDSIIKKGLKPSKIGIVYLSENPIVGGKVKII